MATAMLESRGHEENLAAERTVAPQWWRQRHTYALAAMVAVHWLLLAAMPWSVVTASDTANEAFQGAMAGECLLLGLWGALGGLRAIPRWLTVLAVYLAGIAAMQSRSGAWGRAEAWDGVIFSVLMGWLLVSFSATFLVPLRGLLGWRVDFDQAYYGHIQTRRGQVTFMQMAAYTCCIAVPLALIRLFAWMDGEIDGAELFWFVLLMAFFSSMSWGPALLLLAARPWLAIPGTVLWTLAAIVLFAVSMLAAPVVGDSATELWAFVRVGCTISLIAVVTILSLRWFGLRLLVVGRPPANCILSTTRR